MCGIFGYVGKGFTADLLIEGIKRLEYRGYDSWGIAIGGNGDINIHRVEGRIADSLPETMNITGASYGIAHTRWATHGAPTARNAHPHTDCTGSLVLVHNGIIENYKSLQQKLKSLGHTFTSETDSEVLPHLIEQLIKEGLEFRLAFLEALKSVEGTYGIALISSYAPGKIFLGRMSSPLVIGQGEGFTIVASDPSAIIPYTRYVVYLDDGDCAILSDEGFESFRLDETPIVKEVEKLTFDLKAIELGGYHHFMEKEIHEQPQTINDAMRGRLRQSEGTTHLGGIDETLLLKAQRVKIIACGTSWHAGLIGKYILESIAGIPTEVCYAAEFRYAQPVIEPNTLVIAISQSGETADTLAGVRQAKHFGAPVMGIVNVVGSTIARECGQGVFLHAGPEIGVASTKAFTSQVVTLVLLTIEASRLRHRMSLRDGLLYLEALKKLSEQASEILKLNDMIKSIALEHAEYTNFLYIGRLLEYPLALEGALKLKEISYIHAEGIPAAELKHGPIALIDKNMPVVVLAVQTTILEKMVSNVNEIRARGGRIIALVREGSKELDKLAEHIITIPSTLDTLVPVLGVIPLQLLAYHIAVARGCDVDKPRNLAKSVTVE
ncbi:MAG TPA: glutamine--fructose-6-phosphate transaminase (isomerizing) [Anaerolineae bacterium]|nr:glutamine--fructose-6-phosphate transaminase (isomerizing) [Anaerolineae bacterium]